MASLLLHLASPEHGHAAPVPGPRFELATVLRDNLDLLRNELSAEQAKHVAHVLSCRTAELGGHLQHCDRCGLATPSYNSCRDRHCPRCQALDQLRWYEARVARGVPVRYFHVVSTVPAKLRPLFRANSAVLYSLLLSVSARVVLDLAAERLGGARSGVTAVLHTWNARYRYHPHAHLIVLGGGLAEDGEWVPPRKGACLLPADLLRERLRVALLAAIASAFDEGSLVATTGLHDLLRRLARPEVYWHGYAKRTLSGAEDALRYLARYACRPGFSNERILSYDGKTVVFTTKHQEQVSLSGLELFRLFLQHELPRGFMRIRHYGILSGRVATEKLALARASLARQGVLVPPLAPPPSQGETFVETWKRLRGVDLDVCPRCEGRLARIPFVGAAHEQRLRVDLEALRRRRRERPP